MTLSQIMSLALRQLDEDPEDISEYDEMFRVYANMGYQIAVRDYAKPRETRRYRTNDRGEVYMERDVSRIVELRLLKKDGEGGRSVPYALSPTGECALTQHADAQLEAVCEVMPVQMETETDEPVRLPAHMHAALADYICYRHLSNGNMAKQSKAQYYLQQFYQAMQALRPQGMGSVTQFRNLYKATGLR